MLYIFTCNAKDVSQTYKERYMSQPLKDKIDWFAFGRKLWFKGIRSALQDEIVSVTENHFDDLAVTMVDNLVDRLLPDRQP